MVYQLETTIARRTILKGVGLAALCGVVKPLEALAFVPSSESEAATAKCPVCQAVHGSGLCST